MVVAQLVATNLASHVLHPQSGEAEALEAAPIEMVEIATVEEAAQAEAPETPRKRASDTKGVCVLYSWVSDDGRAVCAERESATSCPFPPGEKGYECWKFDRPAKGAGSARELSYSRWPDGTSCPSVPSRDCGALQAYYPSILPPCRHPWDCVGSGSRRPGAA